MTARPVRATYRLQFYGGFPLAHATALTRYLDRLGISHIHSSPILRARSGSTHGYDVVDPTALNPELGTEDDLHDLVRALHRRQMGLLLDIVPNHMAAAPENAAWEDVLRHGAASPYARWFDINWHSDEPARWSRIVLPVLGERRARLLERDEISLRYDAAPGEWQVVYADRSFPVEPATLGLVYGWLREVAMQQQVAPAIIRRLERAAADLRKLPRQTDAAPAALALRRDRGESIADDVSALWRDGGPISRFFARAVADFHRGEAGRIRIRRLLDAQPYRLVHWRRAAREINYRRFFDVNDLVALRMEDPEVFRRTHALVLQWVRIGWLDGFRIDHLDGLLDPAAYLARLADSAFGGGQPGQVPVYVEKILGTGERLRPEWPVAGTTGYDFLNQAESLFIALDGWDELVREYHRITRRPLAFEAVARLGKRRALEEGLSSALGRVASLLESLANVRGSWVVDHETRLTTHDLAVAVTEAAIYLPVYRTYVDAAHPVPRGADRRLLETALEATSLRGRAAGPALQRLREALLSARRDAGAERVRLNFVERFQQLTGPAEAKGVEDTAFYVFVPLVSRNEVGGDPGAPPANAPDRFHRANLHRADQWPRAMLAATTHDTKRSADVRARLDVLSEISGEWGKSFYRWRRWNRAFKRRVGNRLAPDVNTTYLLHQTIVGIWPLEAVRPGAVRLPDQPVLEDLRHRMTDYALKAAHEAKQETSWVDPNEEFDRALTRYTEAMLRPDRAPRFLEELGEFVARIARPGMWNSLSRTLLQLTSPGVPDIYQGDELWNFSLVDPDNRRPVDFAERQEMLSRLEKRTISPGLCRELIADAEDGRIKLYLTWRALQARRDRSALFLEGSYHPLTVRGRAAHHVVAFARRLGGECAVTIVPRLTMSLLADPTAAPTGALWGDTVVILPSDIPSGPWRNVFTAEPIPPGDIPARAALADFPVALLVR